MRTFFISLSLIAIVVAALWQMGLRNSVNESPMQANVTPLSGSGSQSAVSEPVPSEDPDVKSPHNNAHTNDAIAMTAPNIKLLPLAQQQEIKRLSGRDNPDSNIIEVQPGVFLMTDGPKVVPVAVVNADGSVTVHEY
jgi:hypothetical protein